MARVKLRKNERPESLIRRFQRAVEQAGIMKEIKRRRYYLSPSERRKEKRKIAEKRRRKEARGK
tara:strand:- start:146 stop:337 length:192 start_codon:yes stop_codon:yes gene_type:complete